MRHYFREHYGIDVGMYSYGCFDRWRMAGPLRVGRYCSIASTARSINNNHWTNALTTHPALYEKNCGGVVEQDHAWDGYMTIEDDVWIGHNAVILPGCQKVGRGAVIGAGAIVTRDLEPYSVVVGNPARKLRDRFPPELAAAIEATRWWELDMADLRHLVQKDRNLVFRPDLAAVRHWLAERDRE